MRHEVIQPLNPDPSTLPLPRAIPALLIGYLLLLLLGIGLFRSPIAMPRGNEMPWDRAVFSAVNAGTLTGFQPFVTAAQYQWAGQMMTLVLVIGGILFTLIVGGALAVRILGLRYRMADIVGAAIACLVVSSFLGALFLSEPGRPLAGIFHGAAAFGNCGLRLSAPPSLASWRTQLVLFPLAVAGGLGLPVLMEWAGWIGGRNRLGRHARTVFAWTAGLFLVGLAALLLLWLIDPAGQAGTESWRIALGAASAGSLDSRTPGLPLAFMTLFPAASMQWVAMVLMAIGTSPAGTGGGLKTTTLAALVEGVRRAFRGEPAGRLFAIAAGWLGIYCAVGFACLIALLIAQPQLSPDRLLFLSVSALSNVGLSKDPIAMTGPGLYILSITMLLGRLLPMGILWWTLRSAGQSDLVVG